MSRTGAGVNNGTDGWLMSRAVMSQKEILGFFCSIWFYSFLSRSEWITIWALGADVSISNCKYLKQLGVSFFFLPFFGSISMSFSFENRLCLEVVLDSSSNFESVSQGEFDCSWWATWWWCHLHLLRIFFVSFTGWMKSQIMGEHHLRNL